MRITIKGVDKIAKDFDKFVRTNERASARAMNSGLAKARTDSLANTRGTFKDVYGVTDAKLGQWKGIGAKRLKAYTRLKKGSAKNLRGHFIIEARPIELLDFGSKQNTRGVSYKLKGKRRTMKSAFIAKGGRGKRRVYTRTSKKRLPIKPKVAITATSMYLESQSDEVFMDSFEATFRREYARQLRTFT